MHRIIYRLTFYFTSVATVGSFLYESYKWWYGNTNDLSYARSTDQNIFYEYYQWYSARIPNLLEVSVTSVSLSVVSFLFEDYINALVEKNPVAKAVVRDSLKIPSNIAAVSFGTEFGGTGVKYDEGNILSSVTKVLCKFSVIGGYFFGTGGVLIPGRLEGISKLSNHICEPVPRLLALISQEKQNQNDTSAGFINYIIFSYDNINKEMVFKAIGQSMIKTYIAEKIGDVLSDLHITQSLKSKINILEKDYVTLMIKGVDMDGQHTWWEIFEHARERLPDGLWQYTFIFSFAAVDVALKTAAEMIMSYLIIPPTRVVQDGVGQLFDSLHLWYYSANSADTTITSIADTTITSIKHNTNSDSENSKNSENSEKIILNTLEQENSIIHDEILNNENTHTYSDL